MVEKTDHADSGWDDYAERVLRNEGRLVGLENLVAETREADRKLIEQRSDSLAAELERRAEALQELVTARADATLALSREEREADRREVESLKDGIRREGDITLGLLRELYDGAIAELRESLRAGLSSNLEQSGAAIHELELRRQAATEKVEQMVRQWRESDKEARNLFAADLARHLDALNHNNERMREFQANSVTRELWQAEKDAAARREMTLRDQFIALDRGSAEVLENKISVVADQLAELKSYRDRTQGRSAGYQAFYGWGIAAITVVISVVILANTVLS